MCTEVRREFRKQFINDLKQHYGCAICNSRTDLTFHHIFRSSKKFNIANKKTAVSTKTLIEEINKTVVLCLHCHNVYHSYESTNWSKYEKIFTSKRCNVDVETLRIKQNKFYVSKQIVKETVIYPKIEEKPFVPPKIISLPKKEPAKKPGMLSKILNYFGKLVYNPVNSH
jgi:hypothetical protein